MSRGRLTFKERDLVRAVRAHIKAGVHIARTRIKPDGEIIIEHGDGAGDDEVDVDHGNPWDKAVAS